MRMKAIYKDNVLRPLKKFDLQEGEVVEINMISTSLSKEFQGTLRLPDQKLIEEIAECDDITSFAKSYGITNIATNDRDYEKVEWLNVWKP